MKRAFFLILILSMLVACSSAPVEEETSILDAADPSSGISRPSEGGFENFSDGLSEHFRDCKTGLTFTFRALESRFRETSERFAAAFE